MKDIESIIVENSNIRKDYYLMKLEVPYIAENAKPGHFVMVTVSRTADPLLKRPFGIYKVEAPYIWLYYQVVGRGTAAIAGLAPGDKVRTLGPLGNGFPEVKGKNILMVAGGRGIAPLHYAIDRYTANNKVILIYGARTMEDLNLQEELKALPIEKMFLYTDDGSAGKKGFVTTDIREIMTKYGIDVTFSCGPDAMFENLAATIGDTSPEVANYVSLEALMGCGFGVCHSCAVLTVSQEYKKVCADGPVFRMEDIQW
ncbi:MAG: dihydroorotate dehydrogenase electron transfer subunit [bacterium]|nr:dihydroorotate dehydrogenase electron transfer subunit [bacterium]